eukprot:TRINITY_DN47209_c0_g1_i1.p2 TRINITY_DN47209_c0_g1~~TRINITY_DN47209_c0_g1_i1.p2  ORF type:complete len:162 (+),score=45.42 TRINITY_DN47209_c0_g1_i1:137-622(+)
MHAGHKGKVLGSLDNQQLKPVSLPRVANASSGTPSASLLERNWKDQMIFRYGFSSFKQFKPVKRTLSPPPMRSRVVRPQDAAPPGYTLPSAFDLPRFTHKPIPSFAGGEEVGNRESWMQWDTRTSYLTRSNLAGEKCTRIPELRRAKSPMNGTCALTIDEF